MKRADCNRFNGALSIELTNNNPNMRIIHRRVALILGQWVSEIKDDTRRPVYCALIKLLQEKGLCVRLAASSLFPYRGCKLLRAGFLGSSSNKFGVIFQTGGRSLRV